MAIEFRAERTMCFRCGASYGQSRGNFPVSYAVLHKGVGFAHVCRNCIDEMYNGYLAQCNNARDAVRQMCRKLDLFWNDNVFNLVSKKSTTRSLMSQYLSKLNSVTFAGKCYDDTLLGEGTLWSFDSPLLPARQAAAVSAEPEPDDAEAFVVPEEVVAFWGSGYPPDMYRELEQRRCYYMSKFPQDAELDVGTEVLIRQICNLEVSIAKDSAAGKSIDKSVNALNTLLGSLNLKPAQKKSADEDGGINAPLGVWLDRFEHKRPLPEISDGMRDVNGVKKYVFTWMGHLCKMLGIKNGYSKLYEDEITRLRVEKPEYDDEMDEDLLSGGYLSPPKGGEGV